MAELLRCRSCNKTYWLLTTDKGSRMPVDPYPTGSAVGIVRLGAGNCVVLPGDRVHVLKKDEPYDGELYTSHFATCRDAGRWWNKGALRRAADAARRRVFEGLDG